MFADQYAYDASGTSVDRGARSHAGRRPAAAGRCWAPSMAPMRPVSAPQSSTTSHDEAGRKKWWSRITHPITRSKADPSPTLPDHVRLTWSTLSWICFERGDPRTRIVQHVGRGCRPHHASELDDDLFGRRADITGERQAAPARLRGIRAEAGSLRTRPSGDWSRAGSALHVGPACHRVRAGEAGPFEKAPSQTSSCSTPPASAIPQPTPSLSSCRRRQLRPRQWWRWHSTTARPPAIAPAASSHPSANRLRAPLLPSIHLQLGIQLVAVGDPNRVFVGALTSLSEARN